MKKKKLKKPHVCGIPLPIFITDAEKDYRKLW